MNSKEVDYTTVLEDLRYKRDQLNVAIAAIEQLAFGRRPATGGPAANGGEVTEAPEVEVPLAPESRHVLREDAFFGLSASAAAKKFLLSVKRPANTQEMVDALKQGGLLTNAQNFYSNLYTTLKRSNEFVNLGKGRWGLTEWYPNRPRNTKKVSGAMNVEPLEGEPSS